MTLELYSRSSFCRSGRLPSCSLKENQWISPDTCGGGGVNNCYDSNAILNGSQRLKQRALEAPMESFKSAKQKFQSIHHRRMTTVYVEKVNTVTHPLASSIGICRHHTADAPVGSE